MKKIGLILAFVLAGSVFGADLSSKSDRELIGMIDSKDINSLADSAFEIRKRASEAIYSLGEACEAFHNIMQGEMMGMTDVQREKFREEFQKALSDRISKLTSQERAKFNSKACKNLMKVKHKETKKMSGCEMMNGVKKCASSAKNTNKDERKCGHKAECHKGDFPMQKAIQ